MERCGRYGVVTFVCSVLVVSVVVLMTITPPIYGRELRPSEHGLEYEESSSTPTTKDDVPEMQTFFNGKPKPATPLPVAKNVTEWWGSDGRDGRKPGGNDKGDHVRVILLVASFVCGLIGVVLLLTSALVFLLRYRKEKKQQQQQRASTSITNNNNNNNKKLFKVNNEL